MRGQAFRAGTCTSWVLAMAIGSLAMATSGRATGQIAHERPDATTGGEPCAAAAGVHDFPGGEAWTIENGLAWGIGSSGLLIFVPQGFVHDRTSVPPQRWTI